MSLLGAIDFCADEHGVPLDALRRDAPPPTREAVVLNAAAKALRLRMLAPMIAADYRDGHPAASIRKGYGINHTDLYRTLAAEGVPLRYPALRGAT